MITFFPIVGLTTSEVITGGALLTLLTVSWKLVVAEAPPAKVSVWGSATTASVNVPEMFTVFPIVALTTSGVITGGALLTLLTASWKLVVAEAPSSSVAVIVTVCDCSGPSVLANDQ